MLLPLAATTPELPLRRIMLLDWVELLLLLLLLLFFVVVVFGGGGGGGFLK